MTELLDRILRARSAIVSGDTHTALVEIEKFAATAEQLPPPDAETKDRIKSALAELDALARASMEGVRLAVDQIREIVAAAQTLQTYDDAGQKRVAHTVARMPRRF